MVKQYSKIAIINWDLNKTYTYEKYSTTTILIDANFDFIPKYAFMYLRKAGEFGGNSDGGWITSIDTNYLQTMQISKDSWKFSKEKVEFKINSSYGGKFSLKTLFLIG